MVSILRFWDWQQDPTSCWKLQVFPACGTLFATAFQPNCHFGLGQRCRSSSNWANYSGHFGWKPTGHFGANCSAFWPRIQRLRVVILSCTPMFFLSIRNMRVANFGWGTQVHQHFCFWTKWFQWRIAHNLLGRIEGTTLDPGWNPITVISECIESCWFPSHHTSKKPNCHLDALEHDFDIFWPSWGSWGSWGHLNMLKAKNSVETTMKVVAAVRLWLKRTKDPA